jgi:hypothetical protein
MTTDETEIYKSIRERCKTVIPLVCRHPVFQPERDMRIRLESDEYIGALYEGIFDEFHEKGLFLVYLCAPLKPTYKKTGMDHILDAVYHASQIVGSEYNGKKFAIWTPQYHGLTMANEFLNPSNRGFAMMSNIQIIWEYRPTLVQVGERISEGMEREIEHAKYNGCDIFHFGDFKKHLNNLPSPEEVEIIFNGFVEGIPSSILNHPAANRKREIELFTQSTPRFSDIY